MAWPGLLTFCAIREVGFRVPIPVGVLRNLAVSGGVGTRTGVSALHGLGLAEKCRFRARLSPSAAKAVFRTMQLSQR